MTFTMAMVIAYNLYRNSINIIMSYTTLSIDKALHRKAATKAKGQYLNVSTVTRMLLDAYVKGKINLMAIQMERLPSYTELGELEEDDISPEIAASLKQAQQASPTTRTNI
jgi:hypothetical protein